MSDDKLEPPVYSEDLCPSCAEGDWGQEFLVSDITTIQPEQWPGKKEWLRRAFTVQTWMSERGQLYTARGMVKSLFNDELLSESEYSDPNFSRSGEWMHWTIEYVEHYVNQHNVAPTKRFYAYILEKYDDIQHPHST